VKASQPIENGRICEKYASDKPLAILRAKRWHAGGGQGAPPDLAYIREDCIEEIAAEFFEGEPGPVQNGKSLVRFGSNRDRLFFISELFTEYDPVARTWKTYCMSRRGTDLLSLAACREDGTALDGYEKSTFGALEKRSVDYATNASGARIQIVFQPPPLGEESLYALIADDPLGESIQGELGLGDVPKRRRRGRRLLKPEPLDIPIFIKQGQHLTNQLLGRPTASARPVILEQLPPFKFPTEIREQIVQRNIRAIGADLTSSEHQALNAVLKLLTLHGYRERTIRVLPDHWYEAYGVSKHEHSRRGTPQYAQRHKVQAMQSLASIAAQPMLISYKRRNENERWDVVQRITSLVKVSSGYLDVEDKQADELMNGILLDAIDNLRVIEIQCDELFFDQIHQHYFKRPRDLEERLRLASNHRRVPDSMYNFLNYLYSEGEMLRRKIGHNPETDWTLRVSLTDLAYLLRMKDKIKHGERGRVLREIEKIVGLVKGIGILKSYDLRNEDALFFEIDGKEAFPANGEEAPKEDSSAHFSLLAGVEATLAAGQCPTVQAVIDSLNSEGAILRLDEQNAIARSIKNAASRLLNFNVIVPEKTFSEFLSKVAANVGERKDVRALDRYFASALEQRFLAAMEAFSRESKDLECAAESNPRAAAKLEYARAYLRSLTN
jgi:hypothetical protein